jgi:hypothetical protein
VAIKRAGAWSIQKLVLKVDGREGAIDVINATSAFRGGVETRLAPVRLAALAFPLQRAARTARRSTPRSESPMMRA